MNESTTAAGEKLEFLDELNRLGSEKQQPDSGMSAKTTNRSSASRVRSLDDEVRLKVEASKQKAAKMREKRRMLDAIARKKLEAEEQSARSLKEKDESLTTQESKREDPIQKAPLLCQSLLKSLLNKPSGVREIELDSLGQVQSMAKLDLEKMPMSGYFVVYFYSLSLF